MAFALPTGDPIAVSQKTIIYVGGLDEAVEEQILTAAFRPFGEITSVLLPKDAASR
jgi:RNA recognition motif-containing protein